MYGGDSPDYSAPGSRRRPERTRSPQSYSPPRRDRSQFEKRSPSDRHHRHDDFNYRGKSRSHYSDRGSMKRSRSRTPPRYSSRRSCSRSRSKSPSSSRDIYQRDSKERKYDVRGQRYPWEDEETLRSLHCKDCNVTLNDRDSMMSHLKGTQHLMQLKRLKDDQVRKTTGGLGLNDVLVPNYDNYDPNFWNREKGPQKLRPDQERFLNTERLDAVPAKFNPDRYDHGQYKFNESELYCEPCDVWVRSRDQMQAHKEGANHKKKSAKIQRFSCRLCLIEVPCQDTLNNHMRGKDHIKREKQLTEQRRQQGRGTDLDVDSSGYKTGPKEMARLNNDDFEELEKLRKENKILKKKLEEYVNKHKKCVQEHGAQEFEDLRKHKQWCLEKHIRPTEMGRRGLHVKKEEVNDDLHLPSTSSSPHPSQSSQVKQEANVKNEPIGRSDEYVEHEQDDDDVIVLNN